LPRFYLTLILSFGIAAAVIAAFGLYGSMAQVVALRSPELALRRVMGARSRQLAALLLREAGLIVGAGLAVGLPLSWLALVQLSSLRQFPVTPEAGALVVATFGIVLVCVAALVLPLRSVVRLEPQELLRSS
jgi:ABC-type antimicrobial peptide transport system permease subunit